jgi:hypothetical protein
MVRCPRGFGCGDFFMCADRMRISLLDLIINKTTPKCYRRYLSVNITCTQFPGKVNSEVMLLFECSHNSLLILQFARSCHKRS